MKEGSFTLEIRNTFFPLMIMRHWNRLSRESVDALSLELFKTQLGRDSEQLTLVKVVPAYSRRVGRVDLQRSLSTRTIL